MWAFRFDDEVLDILGVHKRRKLDRTLQVPLHPAAFAAATNALLKGGQRGAKPHDGDLRAGDRGAVPI